MRLSRIPPWTYGFWAAVLMLGVIGVQSGFGSIGPTLSVALAFGAISVLVGTGQMFVIASGPGNLDLSVPSVLTLAAYVSMTVMDRTGGMISVGIVAALAVGAVAGCLNYAAIRFLRLPPIIATLAWSFIFQSFAFNLGGQATLKPPQALSDFTNMRLGWVQVMPLTVLLLTVAAASCLAFTVWGRNLLATGQNERAAHFAGVRVGPVRLVAYVICGMTAAMAGVILSGFTGGAALNMGNTYLMESIAIVALGGTSVAGGQANAIGIWGAALFFNLMGTMLNIFQADAGLRFVLMGILIVLIVAIVPRPEAR
jgi:ribose transport system permease protein